MESMQHTARGIPDEAAAIHNADREITEDTDLNDLPVHFQPMEDGGRGRAATGVLPSPHTPLGRQTMANYQDQQMLTDARTQQQERGSAPIANYPPPSLGKVDSGCQYSPSDFGHLNPSPGLSDPSPGYSHPATSVTDQRFMYPGIYPAPPSVADRPYYPPHGITQHAGSSAVYTHTASALMHIGLGNNGSAYRPPALHHPAVSNGAYRLSHPVTLGNTIGLSSYTAASLAGTVTGEPGRPSNIQQASGASSVSHPGQQGGSSSSGGDKNGSGHVGGEPIGGHVGGERNRGHLGGELNSGHLGGELNSSHLGGELNSGHVGGELNSGHLGGELNSGHLGGELNSGHVGGERNRGHLRGELNSGHLGGERNSSHLGGELNSGHVGGEGNSSGGPVVKPYKCPECDASFTRVDHLSRHLRTQRSHFHSAMADKGSSQTQPPAQYHACPHCSKLFTRRDHMKRHSKIHLRGEPVKCVECLMWFPAKAELNRHLLDVHDIQVFECAQCGKGFLEADYLTRHLRDKHNMGDEGAQVSKGSDSSQHDMRAPYRCGICSLYFATESESTAHMNLHSRQGSNPAPTVPLAPSQRVDVRDVASLSSSLAPVWPGLPHQQHNRALALLGGHLAGPPFSHTQLQPLKAAPYVSNGVNTHPFPPSHAPLGGQEIKREPCDRDCATKTSGLQGIENGEVERGAENKSHLSVFRPDPMTQPSAKRPFVCGVCGSAFTRPPSLKIHLRKHCGHRPFPCMECTASFASASNLLRHQRTHSGERPFKCDQCTAAFTHKGALINHERVHTGQRPYECELCGASFARCDALSRHKKTHKENRIKMEQEALSAGLFALYS